MTFLVGEVGYESEESMKMGEKVRFNFGRYVFFSTPPTEGKPPDLLTLVIRCKSENTRASCQSEMKCQGRTTGSGYAQGPRLSFHSIIMGNYAIFSSMGRKTSLITAANIVTKTPIVTCVNPVPNAVIIVAGFARLV